MLRLSTLVITIIGLSACTSGVDPFDTPDGPSPTADDYYTDRAGPGELWAAPTRDDASPYDAAACDGEEGIQLLAEEYLREDGLFHARVSTPQNAIVQLAPPSGGRFRVSAIGVHLWHLCARSVCTDPETESACDEFLDYHSPDPFEDPLIVDVDIAEGDSAFVLLGGCLPTSCSYDVTVHPPLSLGDACEVPYWGNEVRRCNFGLVCLRERSEMGVGVGHCEHETAPDILDVEATRDPREGYTVRFRITGRDETRDVQRVGFQLVGERGVPLDAPIEREMTVSYADDDTFTGVASHGFSRGTWLSFWLIDASGLESSRFFATVGAADLLEPGESCDSQRVTNVCPERTYCGGSTEFTCNR
jgi:hypothetical protein